MDTTSTTHDTSLNNSQSPYPGSLSPYDVGPPLLPAKRTHHKVTLILDLDETLVHSSFKPVPNSDWIVPVEVRPALTHPPERSNTPAPRPPAHPR